MFLDSNINIGLDVNKLVDQINQIAAPAVQQVLKSYIMQFAVQGQVDMHVGMIWGIAAAVTALFAVAMFIFSYKLCHYVPEKGKDETDYEYNYRLRHNSDDDGFVVGAFVVGVVAVILALIFGIVGVNNYVTGYQESMNPSYYAIHQILNDFPVPH